MSRGDVDVLIKAVVLSSALATNDLRSSAHVAHVALEAEGTSAFQ
jgi:hypothetical protein